MNQTIIAAGFGCLGGLTRSIVGIFKAKARRDKIKPGRIIRTLRLSAISGTFIGMFFGINPLLGFIAGHVGSDIFEGAYYSFKRTKLGKMIMDI